MTMSNMNRCVQILVAAALMCGCAQASGSPTTANGPSPSVDLSAGKTLVTIVRSEASSAAAKALQTSGSNITPATLFNAGLAILDVHKVPYPELAESLPQLNTDSWKVFPDGRMETTYHLKPNLTWQDGSPLSAEDFVLGLRVY